MMRVVMGSQSKGQKKVKRSLERYCEENGFTLVLFDPNGKGHGKIKVKAHGRIFTVGMSKTPKAGWESCKRMVLAHLRNKIMRHLNDQG